MHVYQFPRPFLIQTLGKFDQNALLSVVSLSQTSFCCFRYSMDGDRSLPRNSFSALNFLWMASDSSLPLVVQRTRLLPLSGAPSIAVRLEWYYRHASHRQHPHHWCPSRKSHAKRPRPLKVWSLPPLRHQASWKSRASNFYKNPYPCLVHINPLHISDFVDIQGIGSLAGCSYTEDSILNALWCDLKGIETESKILDSEKKNTAEAKFQHYQINKQIHAESILLRHSASFAVNSWPQS